MVPSTAMVSPLLTLFGLLGLSIASPVGHKARATVCNGHAELCTRGYGNTTFLASHDSYAVSTDPLALSRVQEVDLTAQLNLGVRMLQAQSHMNDGVLHFCHTSCALFDGGPVVDYLTTVKSFLDANPNEVLTLLFTNPEAVSLTDIWEPVFDDSGMTDLIYVPPTIPETRADWPTLGDMIDSGKRVVAFLDAGADTTVVDFLLPEFEMLWEPPFDSTDSSFPCSVDRTAGPLSTQDHMNMLNHNLDVSIFGILIPDYTALSTTNSVASIMEDANGCAPLAGGVAPNFVMLDFVDVGEGMSAVDMLNGFT